MSRSTQFIGLNSYALAYVENLLSVSKYSDMTFGMFGESISGNIYQINGKYGNIDVLREVVQDTPWSSGVMIFTCLRLEKTIRENMPDIVWNIDTYGENINFFRWMLDPSLEVEFDYKTGRYWV